MKNYIKYIFPNFLEKINIKIIVLISISQLLLLLMFCQINPNELIPKPFGIFKSIEKIVFTDGFIDEFFATFHLILTGMGLSVLISLILCYLSLIPFFHGISVFVSLMRYLTYTGLIFIFTIILKNGHDIKISLLLYGIIPYFTTTLLSYINDIPKEEYELAYTLKLNRWQVLYEVVIRGKLHLVLEVIKQNFAIAWMMITSVEGFCMSEGGLGTLMIKSNKVMHIDDVFAVLIIIFCIGIFFNYLFGVLKILIFPYTDTGAYSRLWINKIFKKKI